MFVLATSLFCSCDVDFTSPWCLLPVSALQNQTTLNNSCGWLHWILPLFFRALGVSNPTDPRLKIPSVSTELHQEGIEVPSEPVSAAQGVEIVVYQLSAQLSGMVLWQKLLRCTVPYPFRGNFHQTTLDAVALIGEVCFFFF